MSFNFILFTLDLLVKISNFVALLALNPGDICLMGRNRAVTRAGKAEGPNLAGNQSRTTFYRK
jgi:hypothetical protein